MKVDVETNASRCEAGNMDVRVSLQIDTDGTRSWGSAPPLVGIVDHALDQSRRLVVAAIEAAGKAARDA